MQSRWKDGEESKPGALSKIIHAAVCSFFFKQYGCFCTKFLKLSKNVLDLHSCSPWVAVLYPPGCFLIQLCMKQVPWGSCSIVLLPLELFIVSVVAHIGHVHFQNRSCLCFLCNRGGERRASKSNQRFWVGLKWVQNIHSIVQLWKSALYCWYGLDKGSGDQAAVPWKQ